MALDKYHFSIQHRLRIQYRNADGLSKRTNEYTKHERQLGELPQSQRNGIRQTSPGTIVWHSGTSNTKPPRTA